jgi:hypothetical protein
MNMTHVITYRIFRLRLSVVLVVMATATVACTQAARERLAVYPVKGKVLYKGSPLPGALVVLEKSEAATHGEKPLETTGPIRATGRAGPDGSFQLRTYQGNDGAPVGDYVVGVSSVPPKSEGNLFALDPSTKTKSNPDVLRGRYADPKTSGLKAQVKAQDNELPPFDLK